MRPPRPILDRSARTRLRPAKLAGFLFSATTARMPRSSVKASLQPCAFEARKWPAVWPPRRCMVAGCLPAAARPITAHSVSDTAAEPPGSEKPPDMPWRDAR